MPSPKFQKLAEFDTTSALTEISSDLFGRTKKSPETASTEVKTPFEGSRWLPRRAERCA